MSGMEDGDVTEKDVHTHIYLHICIYMYMYMFVWGGAYLTVFERRQKLSRQSTKENARSDVAEASEIAQKELLGRL